MMVRRVRMGVAACVLALGALLGLGGPPALAGVELEVRYLSQLTGTPNGSFSGPRGVAVDQANGNVFVSDTGNSAVDLFDSSGSYLSQLTGVGTPAGAFGPLLAESVAVNDKTGQTFVADSGNGLVYVFDSLGNYVTAWNGSNTPAGSFGGSECANIVLYACVSVAANNSTGDVYVVDSIHDVVDHFDSAGNLIGSPWSGSNTPAVFAGVRGVTVDQASGDVYVLDPSNGVVDVFDPAGNYVSQTNLSQSGSLYPWGYADGVAVDDKSGDVLVSNSIGDGVYVFDLSGKYVRSMEGTPSGHFNICCYVSVTANNDPSSPAYGDIYIGDSGNSAVDVFASPVWVIFPDVATGRASNVTKTSATLNGTVNPAGVLLTECKFEWVEAESSDIHEVPCEEPAAAAVGTGTEPVEVHAAVSGLQTGGGYRFRLVAANANRTVQGQWAFFVTLPPPFAIESFDRTVTNQDGSPDVQAGSHPYAMTTSFSFNTEFEAEGNIVPTESFKDIQVDLPPGIVGDPDALPKCTHEQLLKFQCPASAQVGVMRLYNGFREVVPDKSGATPGGPVYNMVAPSWMPAQLGFMVVLTPVYLDVSVRTGGDYGLTVNVRNAGQGLVFAGQSLTVWGVPADPGHDAQRRGPECWEGCKSPVPPRPYLTLSTGCQGPQTTVLHVDTWAHPGVWHTATSVSHDGQGNPLGLSGCDRLDFSPSVEAAPDTTRADTPAGFTFDVKLGQEGLLNPEGLAGTDIENTTVRLPAGVAINPGQAAGLAACQPGEDGLGTEGPPSCPSASKVGTVQISTPLLPDKLKGNVYILPSDPPDVKLLVAVSADGINVKLVGHVHLDGVTGQLVTTFDGTPQLPFSEFRLSFSGGAQAALVTPTGCGTYQTSADFMPWSSPFEQDALVNSPFLIQTGPVGSPCASPLPFSPEMIAGATTDQAGGFTGFSMLLTRADGQQRVGSLQFKTPPGLLGEISKVQLCGATEAAADVCPEGSQIGHTVVEAGPGPYPLVVPQPGAPPAPIYLTGPYEGAPYGLLIRVPLVVGPFTLQTQVVRARIQVDPLTSQLTITTDPLPTIIDGIPADLRAINAVIDRSHFMFNPTDCEPLSFSGTATSTEGTSAAIASRFEVGSCRSLHFKPRFVVLTAGQTSRRDGASLDARVVFPREAPEGNQMTNQANIRSVKVSLPRALPSRLGTLQKACPAETFQTDPAACPPASRVGSATAITPVLPGALFGPAYFVSHGGAKFPELVIVLSGDDVTVDLHGETFISKAGITSSTFHYVPDVPIESFELKLPQGPYSALAANGDLCTTSLRMPTVFTAQNGMVIHQSTRITPTGCLRHRAGRRARRRHHGRHEHHGRHKHNGRGHG